MNPVREWVTITDPENPQKVYRFDVSFLASNYHCIYGQGCQGIDATQPHAGCCSIGAFLEDGEAEWFEREIRPHLNPSYMENYEIAEKRGYLKKRGSGDHTRLMKGRCIFLNSPEHEKPGCAMHHLAMDRNAGDITEGKFTVCWMVPLGIREEDRDDEWTVVTVAPWSHWTWAMDEDHPEAVDWFCTTDGRAYSGNTPAYVGLGRELTKLVGLPVYLLLCDYMQRRGNTPVTIKVKQGRPVAPVL